VFGLALAFPSSEIGQNAMKTTLVVLFLLFAVAAFGQQSAPVLSSQPAITQFFEHPEHAQPHAMAAENPIAGGASDAYSYAQGEIPLWQLGPLSEPVPLGDVARAFRKEKQVGRKAEVIFEKQGS
jgi:hypothetical protein